MEEPGRVQSMGSQRVGHDWATSLSLSRNFNFSTITQHTLYAMYSGRLLKARKMERDFHIRNHGSLEKFTKLHEILLTYTSPLCSVLFQLVLQSWLIAMDPSWSKICLLFTEFPVLLFIYIGRQTEAMRASGVWACSHLYLGHWGPWPKVKGELLG